MEWPLFAPGASGRKEVRAAPLGQLGKGQATSRAVPSLSFLASGIPADTQGWLRTGYGQTGSQWGKCESGDLLGQGVVMTEASCPAAMAWGHPQLALVSATLRSSCHQLFRLDQGLEVTDSRLLGQAVCLAHSKQ